jgi:hypothetical protein
VNRRSFLQLLTSGALGAAATATLDVERLLWVPKPIITVPAMPLTNISWIAQAALRELQQRFNALRARELDFLAYQQYRPDVVWPSYLARVPGDFVLAPTSSIIGMVDPGRSVMTHQTHVEVDIGPDGTVDHRRDMVPAMAALAHSIAWQGHTAFGVLPLPQPSDCFHCEAATAVDRKQGMALRVVRAPIRQWVEDPDGTLVLGEERLSLRIDVLGGKA